MKTARGVFRVRGMECGRKEHMTADPGIRTGNIAPAHEPPLTKKRPTCLQHHLRSQRRKVLEGKGISLSVYAAHLRVSDCKPGGSSAHQAGVFLFLLVVMRPCLSLMLHFRIRYSRLPSQAAAKPPMEYGVRA